jgi:membrane-bound metal-dependent hydrolase YbcI (DUF457 family)
MAVGHALSGFAAGAALAAASGARTATCVLAGAITAGAALLPDLDHPNATATRRLGWVSAATSRALIAASRATYRATATTRDTSRDGGHRHLTHTVVFAAATGTATHTATQWGGPVAVIAVVAVSMLLATAALGRLLLIPLAAATATWLATTPDPTTALAALTAATGPLVALGCLIHTLGDAITESGVPLLWPLRIHGRRWYRCRIPAPLRLRVGGPGERWVAWPLLTAACVLALPDAPTALLHLVEPALTTPTTPHP